MLLCVTKNLTPKIAVKKFKNSKYEATMAFNFTYVLYFNLQYLSKMT